MALDSERGRVAHLLRRATFGASAGEIDAAAAAGVAATIERLLNPEQESDDVDARFPPPTDNPTRPQDAITWWLLHMMNTRRQFLERMTLFWHGLLTSGLSKTGGHAELMVQQITTYRRLALGSFRDLVLGSAKDPAMILWLDNNQNRKGKPNENYARELMELFTVGIGNYSETDIREAARAFTGWFQRNGEYFFDRGQHDGGAKTVLGFTGDWDGGDIIDILVRQPACARFIARKLWSFFAYPDPEDSVVDDIAAAFTSSGYDIRATMRALLTHPAFFSDRAYHAIVKSPLEFVLGFLRSLEATTDMANIAGPLGAMGQTPMNPPNVAGWPGGATWISSTALITRYNLINGVLQAGADQPTHVDAAALLSARNLSSRGQILDFFIDLMLDGDLPGAKREVLADYLVADDNGKPTTFKLDDRTINNKVRGLIYLIAASPEYEML